MAVLTDTDRIMVWAELMRDQSKKRAELGLSKSELRAAVNATDDWIDDNQASFNNALPPPAKTVLTQKQKALLFLFVASKRYDVEV